VAVFVGASGFFRFGRAASFLTRSAKSDSDTIA
jgi:hypothetical protein